MNILLTGATGFIGNYFFNKYKQKYSLKRFSFLNEDLSSLTLDDINCIIHLSALVHQMNGASVQEYEKVNVLQTLELAKKAKSQRVKHFIFMSTVKVYGEETSEVYSETTDCHPIDEYGISKLKAENELLKLEDEEFKVSIVRTPIVFGYNVKANIRNLVNLVSKVPILPFGSINNKRSMVYVGNLCHLLDSILEQKISGIFLAGDDQALSTTTLIELIAKNLNKKIILLRIPFFEELLKIIKPSFHKRLYGSLEVNNQITKEKLNFKNLYSIDESISFLIKGEK